MNPDKTPVLNTRRDPPPGGGRHGGTGPPVPHGEAAQFKKGIPGAKEPKGTLVPDRGKKTPAPQDPNPQHFQRDPTERGGWEKPKRILKET